MATAKRSTTGTSAAKKPPAGTSAKKTTARQPAKKTTARQPAKKTAAARKPAAPARRAAAPRRAARRPATPEFDTGYEWADDAAAGAQRFGQQAATTLGTGGQAVMRTLDDPRFRSKIPAGSLTILGVGFLIAAVAPNFLRRHRTISLGWTVTLLLLSAVVVVAELTAVGVRMPGVAALPRWLLRVPTLLLAVLLVAHLVELPDLALVPLLWFVATVLVCFDLWRATRLERLAQTEEAEEVLSRVPGRSTTLLGIAVLVLAVLVSLLPNGFTGVGPWWSAVTLVLAAYVAVVELSRAGVGVPQLPGGAVNALISAAFAALVAGLGITIFGLHVVSMLWAVGAVLIVADQFGRWRETSEAAGRPVRLASAGGLAVLAGAVSIFAMFLSWKETTAGGGFSGGFQYTYGYDSLSGTSGYSYEYNPLAYINPIFNFPNTGRAHDLAPLTAAGLVLVAGWAALGLRRRQWAVFAALGIVAAELVWWLFTAELDHFGTWLFLVGLLALGSAAVLSFLQGRNQPQAGWGQPEWAEPAWQ